MAPKSAVSCSLLLALVWLVIGGWLGTSEGENISIQYVIIHSSSNGSSASSEATPAYEATSAASSEATRDSAPSLVRMPMRAEASFALFYQHQIPGHPGKDYPILAHVPASDFRCQQAGYFADEYSGCQVIHICQEDGRKTESFLCPNGTIFNQLFLVCDWWFNVDCSKSRDYYARVLSSSADVDPRTQQRNAFADPAGVQDAYQRSYRRRRHAFFATTTYNTVLR